MNKMAENVDWEDQESLNKLFLGKRIINAREFPNETDNPLIENESGGWITLDDGTEIEIRGLHGGCICGNGDYTITQLNTFDNIIVKVETEVMTRQQDEDIILRVYSDGYTVSSDKGKTVIYSKGTDNGYYGSGFNISVKRPTKGENND